MPLLLRTLTHNVVFLLSLHSFPSHTSARPLRTGKGNFNWRMKFPIKLPTKHYPRFRLQIWDLDFFSPDDSICEAYFSLKGMF